MKIAVRYQSRGGNTKAVAEIIAEECKVQALSIEHPIEEYTDILFLGGGVYMWKMDDSVREFIEQLEQKKVGQIVCFSTTGAMDVALRQMKDTAALKGITVNENALLIKMMLRGHSALGLTGGKLSEEQRKKVQEFVEKVFLSEGDNHV